MNWRRKRTDLAERLRPYLDPDRAPEPMVDVDPIRMFLFRWMIETGDPVEVVAKGFDVDVQLLVSIVSRERLFLRADQARALSARLDLRGGGATSSS